MASLVEQAQPYRLPEARARYVDLDRVLSMMESTDGHELALLTEALRFLRIAAASTASLRHPDRREPSA